MFCAVQTGMAFYNPQTGRWLNRDPIEEKGFSKARESNRQLYRLARDLRRDVNLMVAVGNCLVNNFDSLGLYTPEGALKYGVCCLEEYLKSCKEICRKAMSDPSVGPHMSPGGVACYHGKACGCLGPHHPTGYDPHQCPEIDSILQAHEDHHVSVTECKRCGLYAAGPDDLAPGVDFEEEECEQRKASLKALEAIKENLDSPCRSMAERLIEALRRQTADCED